MKKLIVAKSAGFCFGVSRSVKMAEELLRSGEKCSSLGELIHNADVVNELASRGLRLIESPSEAHAGEKVLIRAHGIARSVQQELERSGAEIVDATCPKVKHIHNIVSEATAEGRFVIIIGMRRHPEVEGICGWCGEHMVFETAAELETWLNQNPDFWDKPLSVVVQTTQTHGNFTECCNILKKRCTNLKISDTICTATSARQQEAEKLASECDAMVVIGGKHSANSLHLAQICSEHCGWVQFIEKCDELDMDKVTDADTIGLTAGASTPAWIIKEVRNKMSDEIKVEESAVEVEKSFDEMLEETLKTIYNGDKVTGHVVAITGTEISVDLGTKYSEAMHATYLDEEGKSRVLEMGCYGIGISRVAGAAIEQNHDDRGMIWPDAIAPFTVAICPMGYKRSEAVQKVCDELHDKLAAEGIDVILDDRDLRPGPMFADWELIGVPHRIVVGDRGLKNGEIEYANRRTLDQKEMVKVEDAVAFIKSKLKA